MAQIQSVCAREILDSRGNPTLETEIILDTGLRGRASVPSGASTGSHEALELRDNDPHRYQGKGVLNAVRNVNECIAPVLQGLDPTHQRMIDETLIRLDGTENKSKLGANAILSASLSVARVAALNETKPLYQYLESLFPKSFLEERPNVFPVPMFNIINGGEHADSGLSIQEFKIVPSGIPTYSEALRAGSEIFHTLQTILRTAHYDIGIGDEGGFAPKLPNHNEAFSLILQAIEKSGYTPGKQIFLDVDVAANSFYDQKHDRYQLRPENVILDRSGLLALYRDWISRFPLFSIEDPLHEEDWDGWQDFTKEFGEKMMLIGDDLLVTNVKRLEKAIAQKACNSVLIKVNQIGTLSETLDCLLLAWEHGFRTVISHRSGETCDDFIADLAVAARADFIKTGSLARGERLAKYNRLLEIASEKKL